MRARSETEPRLRIGAVARLTGVSVHTLRVWERRYGTVTPARTPGGTRLYSPGDVSRLRALKRLVEAGHAIGDVARLTDSQLRRRASPPATPDAPGAGSAAATAVRDRFLEALRGMDVAGARSVLARAALVLEPPALVSHVVAPLLTTIGELWAGNTLCVAQEHAASAVVRTQLGALLALHTPGDSGRVAVCATPEGELHEFGALFAALSVAVRGWRPVYLGPSVPPSQIAVMARHQRADLALVSIVSLAARDASRQIEELAGLLPPRCRLVVGGSGARPERPFPRGVIADASLEELGR